MYMMQQEEVVGSSRRRKRLQAHTPKQTVRYSENKLNLLYTFTNFPFAWHPDTYDSPQLTPCLINHEGVGIETFFSVASASSALHRLVTVFHCV